MTQRAALVPSRSHARDGAPHIVILGGGYAGQMAAVRLVNDGVRARISLVDASPWFVERIRLHQVVAGQAPPKQAMTALLPRQVCFVEGRAVRVDPERRRLELRTPDGPAGLGYDWLVYALGSTTDLSSVPGVREHAAALNSREEAERTAALLELLAPTGGRVLVVGGGLTGIETASELAERWPGLQVQLVSRSLNGDGLSSAGAAHVRRTLERLGVTVVEDARVVRLEPGQAVLADGARRPFDLCLWTAGLVAPPLARESGLPVNASGQLETDPYLRVAGHPEIYAVGDAAALRADNGGSMRMACATAIPSGAHAAGNLARMLRGAPERRFRFGFFVQCISLGRRDGLVLRVNADDSPRETRLTGRGAARVKELICRYAVGVIGWERRLRLPLYQWPRPAAWPTAPGVEARLEPQPALRAIGVEPRLEPQPALRAIGVEARLEPQPALRAIGADPDGHKVPGPE